MNIVGAYFRGWLQALRFPGLWLLKWLLQTLLTATIALPLAMIIWQSPTGDAYDPLTQLTGMAAIVIHHWASKPILAFAMATVLVAFLLANLFISAGIFRTFNRGTRSRWTEFFGDCGRFFLPLLGVTAVNAVLFTLVVGSPAVLLYLGFEPVKDWAESHRLPIALNWLWIAVVAFLISIAARVYDYSRIFVCGFYSGKIFKSVGQAIAFVARRQGGSLLVWICFFVTSILLIGLNAFSNALTTVLPWEPAWIHLIFGEILLILRVIAGLASWSGQLAYFKAVENPEETPGHASASGLTAEETLPGV